MTRRAVALVGALIAAALVVIALAMPASAAPVGRSAQQIAGGGIAVPQELRLVAGAKVEGLFPLYVRNVWRAPLNVKVVERAPNGITISPNVREAVVETNSSYTIPYTLRVDSNAAAGRYPVEISVLSSDLSVTKGEVQFVPALTQRYTVIVEGSAGDLKVRALDILEQRKIPGVFVASRIDGVNRVPIARTEGQELASRVVPGEYEVAFELDGRTIASKTVRVAKDQTTETELEVSLLQFTKVDAKRIDIDGKLAAVALNAEFDNALRPIPGAAITLEVSRDGKRLEELSVQTFQTLSKGTGSVATRFVPRDGWKRGKYEFRFRITGDGITVAAASTPAIQIGAPKSIGLLWLWAALVVFGVLVTLAVLSYLLQKVHARTRRRRKGPGAPPDLRGPTLRQRLGLGRPVGAGRGPK